MPVSTPAGGMVTVSVDADDDDAAVEPSPVGTSVSVMRVGAVSPLSSRAQSHPPAVPLLVARWPSAGAVRVRLLANGSAAVSVRLPSEGRVSWLTPTLGSSVSVSVLVATPVAAVPSALVTSSAPPCSLPPGTTRTYTISTASNTPPTANPSFTSFRIMMGILSRSRIADGRSVIANRADATRALPGAER
jgi:hypothetical protein